MTTALTRDSLYDKSAEMSVIGCLLVEPTAFAEVADLPAGDFHFKSCQYVFEAIQQLGRDGVAIDMLTVEAELKRRGHWAEVGSAFLSECLTATPYYTHVASYIEIIFDFARRRKAVDLSTALAKAAFSGNGMFPAELALTASILTKMSEGLKPSDKSDRLLVHTDIETLEPIKPLDEIVRNVLAAGQVVVWSGDGGLGKTFVRLIFAPPSPIV